MSIIEKAGTFALGDREVHRLGYGAMQLAGPGVFGPPRDHDAALAVLREAVAAGVDHIDTSDFYGPQVTNQLIREALQRYLRPGGGDHDDDPLERLIGLVPDETGPDDVAEEHDHYLYGAPKERA